MLRDKKTVKRVSLIVALVFILGIAGVAFTQTSVGFASQATASAIGVVNYQALVVQHPDMQILKAAMDNEIASAKKEFEGKAASMPQEEQQKYYMQLQERLANKERELMTPLMDKINAAIKKVADTKGLSIVVDQQGVVYGGTNITDEVIKSYK